MLILALSVLLGTLAWSLYHRQLELKMLEEHIKILDDKIAEIKRDRFRLEDEIDRLNIESQQQERKGNEDVTA